MNKQYVLNNTTSSNQIGVIVMSLSVGCFFFLFLLTGWSWAYVFMGVISMLFFIPVNIFMKRFSEVYTDGTTFFVKNIYQKEQKIDAEFFDKIVDMRTIVWYPNSPYYTIYFKNGMKFNFVKSSPAFLSFAMRDKVKLAKELTRELHDFLHLKSAFS